MSKYYVVSGDILPDVLEQVMQARILLQSGKAKRISEAVKMVGISRGTYYKYLTVNNFGHRHIFK